MTTEPPAPTPGERADDERAAEDRAAGPGRRAQSQVDEVEVDPGGATLAAEAGQNPTAPRQSLGRAGAIMASGTLVSRIARAGAGRPADRRHRHHRLRGRRRSSPRTPCRTRSTCSSRAARSTPSSCRRSCGRSCGPTATSSSTGSSPSRSRSSPGATVRGDPARTTGRAALLQRRQRGGARPRHGVRGHLPAADLLLRPLHDPRARCSTPTAASRATCGRPRWRTSSPSPGWSGSSGPASPPRPLRPTGPREMIAILAGLRHPVHRRAGAGPGLPAAADRLPLPPGVGHPRARPGRGQHGREVDLRLHRRQLARVRRHLSGAHPGHQAG